MSRSVRGNESFAPQGVAAPRIDAEQSKRMRQWLRRAHDPNATQNAREEALSYARQLFARACGDVLVFRALRSGASRVEGGVWGPREDGKAWLAGPPAMLPDVAIEDENRAAIAALREAVK